MFIITVWRKGQVWRINDNVYEEDNFFICYDYITDLLCV